MKTQFDPTLTSHDAEHRTWILGLSFVGIVMLLGLAIVPFATVSLQQAPQAGQPSPGNPPPPDPLPGPSTDEPVPGLASQDQNPGSEKDADQVPSLVKGPALSEIFPLPGAPSPDSEASITVDSLVKEEEDGSLEENSTNPLAPAEEPVETPITPPGIVPEPPGVESTVSPTRPEDEGSGATPTAPAPHAPLPSLTLLPPVPVALPPATPEPPEPRESLPAAEGAPPTPEEVRVTRPPSGLPHPGEAEGRVTIKLPKPREDSFFNNSLVKKYRSRNPTDEISNRDLTEQMGDSYKKAGTFLKYAEKFPDWAQHYNMIKNER